MKVLAVMGSPREKSLTLKIIQMLEEKLQALGEIEFEYIFLKDLDIRLCSGCMLCFEKGEEFCPFKDDTAYVYEKMKAADGVIMACPNYALQVTALTKKLLDRLAFNFHRPCFFHQAWLPIITEGVYGKKKILKYLDEVGGMWGFNLCPGAGFSFTGEKALSAKEEKISRELDKVARRFFYVLKERTVKPNLKMVAIFRLVRTLHAKSSDQDSRDYRYWKEQGWFEKPYYCDVKLNLLQRITGFFADQFAAAQAKKGGWQ